MSFDSFRRTKLGPIAVALTAILAPWILAQAIIQGTTYIIALTAIVAGVFAVSQTLMNWRTGVILFIAWMLFEDLARKYLGNNMAVYFGTDALASACYLSFYTIRHHERRLTIRPSFFIPFMLFFCWSLLESVNPNSPSPWYGLLGIKLDFAYVPLFFLGYALLRNENDLRRFLLINLGIAGLIAALGTAQGISGQALLAPEDLAPDIRALGTLTRYAPITHESFIRPTSVFVSDGRFSAYLLFVWIFGFGAAAYFLVERLPGRKWIVTIMGLFLIAIVLSGSRGSLMYALIGAGIITSVFVREMFWTNIRARRTGIAVATILVLAAVGIFAVSAFAPEALNSRVAFYQQTLSPYSSASELGWRAWGYPISEFIKAFEYPNWVLGSGFGTHSLGAQYLKRFLGTPDVTQSVESGYGNLMLEIGIPGLVFWLLFSVTVMTSGWRVLRRLRGTSIFPVGFVILLFVFFALFPSMLGGMSFENFVTNAYLCLLLGIFFSLPSLLDSQLSQERRLHLGESSGKIKAVGLSNASQPL